MANIKTKQKATLCGVPLVREWLFKHNLNNEEFALLIDLSSARHLHNFPHTHCTVTRKIRFYEKKRDGSHPNVGIYFCTNFALFTFYFLRFPLPFRRPSPHTHSHTLAGALTHGCWAAICNNKYCFWDMCNRKHVEMPPNSAEHWKASSCRGSKFAMAQHFSMSRPSSWRPITCDCCAGACLPAKRVVNKSEGTVSFVVFRQKVNSSSREFELICVSQNP